MKFYIEQRQGKFMQRHDMKVNHNIWEKPTETETLMD